MEDMIFENITSDYPLDVSIIMPELTRNCNVTDQVLHSTHRGHFLMIQKLNYIFGLIKDALFLQKDLPRKCNLTA